MSLDAPREHRRTDSIVCAFAFKSGIQVDNLAFLAGGVCSNQSGPGG